MMLKQLSFCSANIGRHQCIISFYSEHIGGHVWICKLKRYGDYYMVPDIIFICD